MKRPENAFFYILLILAMCAWGGSWTSGKVAAGQANPDVLTFWRFLLTVATFLPLLLWQRSSLRLTRISLAQVILGAICIVGYNRMFFRGLQTGYAGAGGVLVTTLNPILTTLLACLFFQRKITPRVLIGLTLGLIGGFIQLEIWEASRESLLHSGNLFFIIASASWAFLTILSEKSKDRLPLLTFSFYVYLFSTVLILFFCSPPQLWQTMRLGAAFWLNIVYLSLLATTFATTVYFIASARLGSGPASSFIFTVPVSAVLTSWLILGETPRLVTLCGGLIGMAAVYLINSGKSRQMQTAPAPSVKSPQ